jgi:formate dehydrogenase subunit gamma
MDQNHSRHRLPDRLFHWAMAVLVFLLVGTSFLPIIGLKFDWIPIHWVSGILLIAAVLYHLYRAVAVHQLIEMLPKPSDFAPSRLFAHDGPGKYTTSQKLYHLAVSTLMIVLLVTGGLMLVKIDTSFWQRDPSILSDQSWGVVYVCHGGAAAILLFFLILHIYFAFLPEHRKLLVAMAYGRDAKELGKKNEPIQD